MTADKVPLSSSTIRIRRDVRSSSELPSEHVRDEASRASIGNYVAEKSVRTRSSSGISKKRILKDAAEDGEIIEPTTPPKKIRMNDVNSASLVNEYRLEYVSETDTLSQSSSGSPTSLSMSPLKLGSHTDGSDNTPLTLNDGLFLMQSKNKGKQPANIVLSANHDPFDNPVKLSPDEEEALAAALLESKRIVDAAIVHDSDARNPFNTAPISSAAPPTDASTISSGSTLKPRRTFRDVMPQLVAVAPTTEMMSSGAVLQDDLMRFRVRSLPAICQVTNTLLHDPFLASDYALLPALKSGSLISWSSNVNGSTTMEMLVLFSEWARQCPGMDFDTACAAMRFERYKNFVNPCRVSPLDVNILFTSYDRHRSILQCNYKAAICLTPLLSEDSHLVVPASFGFRNKFISGHFHQQEWQRFEGFTTMVFDKPTMIAQIYNHAVSFTTTGPSKADRELPSYSKTPRNPSIFASTSSAGANAAKPNKILSSASFRTYLDYTDEVPIYDARRCPFNFASDLDDVDSILPRFNVEIPAHSFIVVAYTMTHYDKDNRAHLSTNVLFVILVGTE